MQMAMFAEENSTLVKPVKLEGRMKGISLGYELNITCITRCFVIRWKWSKSTRDFHHLIRDSLLRLDDDDDDERRRTREHISM